MRCPVCGNLDDKVLDSRVIEDGKAIRRRRECLACSRRFSTFERVEEAPFVVVKRSGHREPYDRAKLYGGLASALKGRPFDDSDIEGFVVELEDRIRGTSGEVNSSEIGLAVLELLKDVDKVGYLRFASVYKGFDQIDDFEREAAFLRIEAGPLPTKLEKEFPPAAPA